MLPFLRSISFQQPRAPSIRHSELPGNPVDYGVLLAELISSKERGAQQGWGLPHSEFGPPKDLWQVSGWRHI